MDLKGKIALVTGARLGIGKYERLSGHTRLLVSKRSLLNGLAKLRHIWGDLI